LGFNLVRWTKTGW